MSLDAVPQWFLIPCPDGAQIRAPMALESAPRWCSTPHHIDARTSAEIAPKPAPKWLPTLTETAPQASPRERPNPRQSYSKMVLRTVLGPALLLYTAIDIVRPIQRSAYRLIHRGNNAKWLSKHLLHQLNRSTMSWTITQNVHIGTFRNSVRLLSLYITWNLR